MLIVFTDNPTNKKYLKESLLSLFLKMRWKIFVKGSILVKIFKTAILYKISKPVTDIFYNKRLIFFTRLKVGIAHCDIKLA